MNSYEPIWSRIKTKNSASIATHTDNVERVIKAVINLKHRDNAYKLTLSERALKSKLIINKESNAEDVLITVHFSLITTIEESYIGVNTL